MTFFHNNRNHSRQPRPRRKASILFISAAGMICLLGFSALAVDYGLLTVDANRLQRACDAAALAGASQLKKSGNDATDEGYARIAAYNVAKANGVTINATAGTGSNVTFSNSSASIRVTASYTRNFLFAPVLGIKSSGITKEAFAGVQAVGGAGTAGSIPVVPIGITWETYNAYRADYTKSSVPIRNIELVRQNKQTFGLDELVLFDLRSQNSKSGAHMERQLDGSEPETSSIGDYETTLNASLNSEGKKFEDGLQTRFDNSSKAPWLDSNSDQGGLLYNAINGGTGRLDNPRVVYLIVTPSTTISSNGTYDTQVQGFAPVYIEGYEEVDKVVNTVDKKGNPTTTTEKVLQMNIRFLPAQDINGLPAPGTGTSTSGIRSVSLTG